MASNWVPELFDLPVPIQNLPPGFRLVADINGDGRLEAMRSGYVSPGSYEVSIAMALSSGSYAFTFDAGFGGTGATSGIVDLSRDLDGDGKLDLVVTDQLAGGSSTVLKGDGKGHYTPWGIWRTTWLIVDLNHDGRFEAYNAGSGTVDRVDLLDDGGVSRAVSYPGAWGGTLTVGEFNADRVDDLYQLETNRVLLGLVDGGLMMGPPSTCTGCTGSGRLKTIDIDRDGFLDVVVATASSTLSIRRNNGRGALDEMASIPLGSRGATGLAVGDVDGDGRPDVVVSEAVIGVSSNDLTSVFFQEAAGTWTAGAPYYNTGLGGFPTHVTDVDSDGRADVVMNGNTAILNRGHRELRTPSLSRVSASSSSDSMWVDFDRDGLLDLALWGNGTFTIYPMSQQRRLTPVPTTCTVAPRKPNERRLLADLTGDGIVDAYTILLGQLDISVGQGGCGFGPVTSPLSNVFGPLRDVDGDGRADLIHQGGSGVPTYLSTGPGTFGPPVMNTLPDDADDARVEDWSGDGKPDLILRWSEGRTKRVLLAQGDGAGRFTAGLSHTYAMGFPVGVAVGDADGDGDPDVLMAVNGPNADTTSLELWRNDGSAIVVRVPEWQTLPVRSGATGLRMADLDLDGRLEVLVLTALGELVYSLNPSLRLRVVIPGRSGVLTDADRDGDLDIVGYQAYDSAMGFVYRNRARD
jgi:hypothetical protein